jgi:hypothetical protein
MNNWGWEFSTGTEVLTMMAVVSCFDDFFKAIIGPKLEKVLGWKPTDWDWQKYWEESIKKAAVEQSQRKYQEWQAQVHARRVIHDFVWNNDF